MINLALESHAHWDHCRPISQEYPKAVLILDQEYENFVPQAILRMDSLLISYSGTAGLLTQTVSQLSAGKNLEDLGSRLVLLRGPLISSAIVVIFA